MRRPSLSWLLLAPLSLLLPACREESAATTAAELQLPTLQHDFGIIPHGERRQHDFVLDQRLLDGRYVALHAWIDCSCGQAELLYIAADGKERPVTGLPQHDEHWQPDDQLVVRVTLDTAAREAVDLPPTSSRGHVLLQPLDARDAGGRRQWPLLLRHGIDAPVLLRPFAAIDFAQVPLCHAPELLTTLRGDDNHPDLVFGPVTSSDPRLEAWLRPPQDGEPAQLRVRCRPDSTGNHRAVISIGTNLPRGYQILVPVTWKGVPVVEARPIAKLSFRCPPERAQTAAEAEHQFLLVIDHDDTRPPEFGLHAIVGDDGAPADANFAVHFAPVPGQGRLQRMFVRSLGGLPQGFRGRIELHKPAAPDTPIFAAELVTFPSQHP